ncbi:MAG: ATP-binding protein, partial [Bacteroidetes bacterium]|nr:ATP-binding protein [Bacteroidota bacterium]
VVREILEKCGQTFRTYRNTVLVLAADEGELAATRQHVKRLLAYRAIHEDKALWRQLSEENRKAVENKFKETEGGIAHRLMSAYRHLAKAGEQGVQWLDLGLPTVGMKRSLSHRVREYLRSEDLLLNKISPRYILEKAMGTEPEKAVDELYEAFLRYSNLPMLESKQVLLHAIAQGVREKVFGVRIGDRTFFGENVLSQLGAGAIVVREPELPPEPPSGTGGGTTTLERPTQGTQEDGSPRPGPSTPVIREYRLEVVVPWDRLSDFVSGVIRPLRLDGAEITLQIHMEAQSQNGIKQMTLEHKVRETLRQIGAQILKEEPL